MTWSHATNALRETHRAIQAPASSRASAAARIAVSDLFPNILTARGAATAVTAATTVPASARASTRCRSRRADSERACLA